MKLLVLTAIIVTVVASSPVTQNKDWPWQLGKEYIYDVNTFTWTQYDESKSIGNAFKTQFLIRVLAPGHLIAKLYQPFYAQLIGEKLKYDAIPADLKYEPVQVTEQPFEIFLDGGRVKAFNVPESLSVTHENLLKALISAIQVDLSTYGRVESYPNSYDKESFQGLFKKFEADVTGECETLYTVSPVYAEWRQELPQFASEKEDPIEIIKGKTYDTCKQRVALVFGVPEGAVWNGIAYKNEEKQFIKHTYESRLVAGKQGTIFKSEVISTVYVSPLLFSKQKAKVFSYVKFYLSSVQQTTGAEWKSTEPPRKIDSLLFTINESMFYPKAGEQNIAKVQKLLQELAPLLQNPDKLSKADFLAKFNILVRYITTFTTEQLNQLSSSVEVARTSKNVAKTAMWIIYRDAVAQAGTYTAFEQIKSWFFAKKVQGEEAAALINSIGGSLRYPSKKAVTEIFNFAFNPEVQAQRFLNTSALLAATKILRYSDETLFVSDTVVPRFEKELKQAVESGDSNKAQTYIVALGNLASAYTLEAVAPYLDGTIKVSKYLRIQVITSLKNLANQKNEYVRAILFSILRNTAEPYEIRVAAALNIFLAFPTAEQMRVMAHMTTVDPSTQVRAVLANSITFAAELKDPRFAELAKTAQSVKDILAKEKFGYRYSTNSLKDEYTSDDDIAFFRELAYIGSKDSLLPIYERFALRDRSTGWTEENQLTLSVSGVQQLLEFIVQLAFEPEKSKVDFKFSAKQIVELLNIKREPRTPLEGALFVDNINQQKLITFTEEELATFIANTVKNVEQLFKGIDIQQTKILNSRLTYVVFPLVTGVPFVYEYTEPLIYSLNGQAKIKIDAASKGDFKGVLQTELDFTYARNLDGSVGFLDTFKDVYASTGVINKIQFYFPAKLNTQINPGQLTLNVVLPEKDATFVHLSVWPYTSFVKFDEVTVAENPTTKYIRRAENIFSDNDYKFGYIGGVGLKLQGFSYSNDFDIKNVNELYDTNILTSIGNLMYQKDVAFTQFNLNYFAKESKNKDITFSFFYDTLYNQKQGGELGPAAPVKDVTANSESRREELVKRVASGIESAQVELYDISVVFDGKQKTEYVLTAALAESYVDNKVQGIFFFNGDEQINAVFKLIKPKVAPLNFEEALKNEIKVTYEADIKFGSSENLQLQGYGVRSERWIKQLKNDPLAKQCLQETSKDNFYQQDCYKLIIKAHAPDYFKDTVTYKTFSPALVNYTNTGFELVKEFYDFDQKADALNVIEDGKIEIISEFFYDEKYANYEFKSKYGVFSLENVEGLLYYPFAVAFYEPITDWERARNWFTGYQNLPYCAVDGSKIWTFSGRSYDYSLTGSWHVVMVDESDDYGKWTDLVILARRPSAKQEEVYISYKTETGKYVEVDIKPTGVEVKSNTKKVSEGALTTYWNDLAETPLLEYYTLAEGVKVFNINDKSLRIIYDSQRLVIFTDAHRSYTRGICGQSSSEIRDDYLTPWGLVDNSEYYGASFSLEGEFSDPKTAELKKEAKLKAYQPVTKYTKIFFD